MRVAGAKLSAEPLKSTSDEHLSIPEPPLSVQEASKILSLREGVDVMLPDGEGTDAKGLPCEWFRLIESSELDEDGGKVVTQLYSEWMPHTMCSRPRFQRDATEWLRVPKTPLAVEQGCQHLKSFNRYRG